MLPLRKSIARGPFSVYVSLPCPLASALTPAQTNPVVPTEENLAEAPSIAASAVSMGRSAKAKIKNARLQAETVQMQALDFATAVGYGRLSQVGRSSRCKRRWQGGYCGSQLWT